jgi:hypothetical protein
MIELGDKAGKQAEKQHCKLEHVMERERERERRDCKRAAIERKHELLRRCSYRWVDSVSGSDDRAPPFCLFLFSRLVKKAAPPLAITDALEKLRFFLPLTHTHTHHEIPLQDSQYRIYLQHTDLSFQWRYPVAVDRVPGSLADSEPAVLDPGAPNLTSREPVPGFETGREDGFSNLVGTETHTRSPFLDYCLTGIKPGAGWGAGYKCQT